MFIGSQSKINEILKIRARIMRARISARSRTRGETNFTTAFSPYDLIDFFNNLRFDRTVKFLDPGIMEDANFSNSVDQIQRF